MLGTDLADLKPPRYLLRAQGPGSAELEIAEVQVPQEKSENSLLMPLTCSI